MFFPQKRTAIKHSKYNLKIPFRQTLNFPNNTITFATNNLGEPKNLSLFAEI